MKNNKGQALVEFVIILPIFLLLIMSLIDFGNIITKKYALENDVDVIGNLYEENKYDDINTYVSDKNLKINYSNQNNLFVINISRDVNIISPLVNLVVGKTYSISVEKSIYRE